DRAHAAAPEQPLDVVATAEDQAVERRGVGRGGALTRGEGVGEGGLGRQGGVARVGRRAAAHLVEDSTRRRANRAPLVADTLDNERDARTPPTTSRAPPAAAVPPGGTGARRAAPAP